MGSGPPEKVFVGFKLPADVDLELRELGQRRDRSKSWLLRHAVIEKLERERETEAKVAST